MGTQRKVEKGVYVDNGNLLIVFTYQKEQYKKYLHMIANTENIKYAVNLYNEINEKIKFDKKYSSNTFNMAHYFPKEPSQLLKNINITEDCMSFGDFAKKVWLVKMKNKIDAVTDSITKKTYQSYCSYLKTCEQVSSFWDYPINKINVLHIEDYIAELAITRKAKSINNLLIPFRPIFHRAFCEGITKDNIMLKVRNPSMRGQQPEINPFSNQEAQQIINVAKEKCPQIELWFAIGFLMGMRITEMQAMKWKYFDFDNWTYHVCERIYEGSESDETKTESGDRVIKIPNAVRQIIEDHKKYSYDRSDYVFLNYFGQPYMQSKHIVSRYWVPILNECGFEFRKMRQMRHSFAIQALEAGYKISDISRYMGHKTVEVTIRRYVKYIKKDDIEINIIPDPES